MHVRVTHRINGFNNRCLYNITSKSYRDTAKKLVVNLLLLIRRRHMPYLSHLLRMPPERLVRRSLLAYIDGGQNIPEGSLLMDSANEPLNELIDSAMNRKEWNKKVMNLA